MPQNAHIITAAEAATLKTRFTDNKAAILRGDFENADPFLASESFDREALELLIAQDANYTGFRIHYGMNTSNNICLIIVTLNEHGNENDNIIVERGQTP
jgi:hypothetical protein